MRGKRRDKYTAFIGSYAWSESLWLIITKEVALLCDAREIVVCTLCADTTATCKPDLASRGLMCDCRIACNATYQPWIPDTLQ